MADKKYLIGVDLGGTNITFAAVDFRGRITRKLKIPTQASRGRDAVMKRIIDGIRQLVLEQGSRAGRPAGVGIGSPGPLNSRTGVIYETPNLPGFRDTALAAPVHKALGLPVYLENDANAAAFGELWAGAGRRVENLVMLTLGTGVGGGIILGGRLYSGVDDTAGELGHMVIDPTGPVCGCGQKGCLEQFASATAIARRARQAVEKGGGSRLLKLAAGDPANISAKLVHEAFFLGDALARKVWLDTCRYLGIGIGNYINIFNPQKVVLGGGVMTSGRRKALFEPLKKEALARAFSRPARTARIVAAELGDEAGVIGAAGLALQKLR